jgi:tetratricopeptide (TPR) repeat protein
MSAVVTALKARARVLVASRDYAGALRVLEQARAASSDDVWVLDMLGFVHFMNGNAERARECCEQSIALRPDNFYAYKGLGLCLVRLGHVNEGIAALERSIELNPRYFDSRHDLALVLLELGRPEPARSQLLAALELAPERAEQVRAVLARISTATGPRLP